MKYLRRTRGVHGLLLVGAAVLLLAACGGDPADPNFPEEPRVPPDSTPTTGFVAGR